MKKTWLFIIVFFCLLVFATSCQDDFALDRPEKETDMPMNTVFELNMVVDGKSGMSRGATDSTIGNMIENRISSVQLFIVPLDDNGEEMWSGLRFSQAVLTQEFKNPVMVQVADFSFSKSHVYVGANMNREQADAFIRSKTGYFEISRANYLSYYSAINQFAPFFIDSYSDFNRNPENIVMFSTASLYADRNMIEEIVDQETGETRKIINLGTATLKRVVAKVLLTCITVDGKDSEGNLYIAPGAETGVQYVKTNNDLIDKSPYNLGPTGWIRQENVYYFINNMPRRVKFLQEYEKKDGLNEKPIPNYNLRKTIVDELGVKFSPLKFNHEKIKNIFIHYDIQELYKRNQSFRQSKIWSDSEYYKLTINEESEYSQDYVGMYTVENMFGVEEGDFTDEELREMKENKDLPFLTKVSIAAKFTPRFIFVTEQEWNNGTDGYDAIKNILLSGKPLSEQVNVIEKEQYPGFILLECSNESVSHEILTSSLRMHGHLTEGEYDEENNPYMYPESTFFVYFKDDKM